MMGCCMGCSHHTWSPSKSWMVIGAFTDGPTRASFATLTHQKKTFPNTAYASSCQGNIHSHKCMMHACLPPRMIKAMKRLMTSGNSTAISSFNCRCRTWRSTTKSRLRPGLIAENQETAKSLALTRLKFLKQRQKTLKILRMRRSCLLEALKSLRAMSLRKHLEICFHFDAFCFNFGVFFQSMVKLPIHEWLRCLPITVWQPPKQDRRLNEKIRIIFRTHDKYY